MKLNFKQRGCRKQASVKVRAPKAGWVMIVNYPMINLVPLIREDEP